MEQQPSPQQIDNPSPEVTPQPQVSQPTPPTHPKNPVMLVGGGLLLLLIIAVAILAFNPSDHSKPSSTAAVNKINRNNPEDHDGEAVVSLTQDGFTPATVKVATRTEVYFDNSSTNSEGEPGSPRRVVQSKAAANQAAYFSSDPIAYNAEYGYTFRTKGTYQFYDYDAPGHNLTVIVN